MTNDVYLNIGRYGVTGTLAKSSSATVLTATDSTTGKTVALKVAGPRFRGKAEASARFLADGQLAAQLSHPNIVRLLDSGVHGEDSYLVLEFVDGGSLDTLLKLRRLSLPEVLTVVKAVAKALDYAHGQGVLHTNLKPRNILLSEDFRTIKITDFGGGRMESAKVESGTIATGQVSVGTVHYASPELAHGTGQPDARSDVYSLGVVFYEMLTGRAPSGRINLPSQLVAGLPPALDPIVLKCLAQDRNQRTASAAALLADINQLEQQQHLQLAAELEGIERTTRRLLGTQPGQAAGSGKGLWIAGGAVAAVVVVGLVVWLLLGGKEPAPAPAPPTKPSQEQPAPTPTATSTEPAPAPVPAQPAPTEPKPVATPSTQRPSTASTAPAKPAPKPVQPASTEPTPAPAPSSLAPAPPSSSAQEQLAEAQRQANAGNVEEARKLYGEVAKQNPGKPEALTALLAKAAIEEKQNKFQRDEKYGGSVPAALVTYRAVTESFPSARQAETAFWKMGEMYEKAKKYELAAQAFSDLGARFPNTQLNAWYRAGQLYDKELKDKARAREAYSKVPASSSNYKDAQARLKKL